MDAGKRYSSSLSVVSDSPCGCCACYRIEFCDVVVATDRYVKSNSGFYTITFHSNNRVNHAVHTAHEYVNALVVYILRRARFFPLSLSSSSPNLSFTLA